jgi:hypothetical protein
MHELTTFEAQDLLPDLLHDRLSADMAAAVRRAVAADSALADELALLRRVHASHHVMPAVDVRRIVAALPPATAHVPLIAADVDDLALRRAARRPMVSQRFARAAALAVVLGGGTLATVYSARREPGGATPVISAESLAVANDMMQLTLGASTDELSVEQLRALEDDIRALDGIPSAEPESGSDLFAGEGA